MQTTDGVFHSLCVSAPQALSNTFSIARAFLCIDDRKIVQNPKCVVFNVVLIQFRTGTTRREWTLKALKNKQRYRNDRGYKSDRDSDLAPSVDRTGTLGTTNQQASANQTLMN